MEIKKAEIGDKKEILDIVNLLYFNIPDFVWNDPNFVEKQIKNGQYFLAEIGGKTVGIISFRMRNKKMFIETLAVALDHQMEGVGAKLIEFAKEYAKENNSSALCACSFLEYKTVDFYLTQGFSLLEQRGIYNNHKYYRFEMQL
ncbi:MAG: GNAT family N-acetyltransferase [Candidatus Pacebacteria bacterium]|nr:GNAT family N-acetyltransferase [Candidatus Paceibacterota bacterium]